MLKEWIKENTKGDDTKIIDDEAFRGCVNLEKVNIPSCVGGIGMMAFPKITYDGNTVSVCSLSLS